MLIPLHRDFIDVHDIPHTVSYVIRKRRQIDNLMELPAEKRPPDDILWHNNPDKLDDWLDDVMNKKKESKDDGEVRLSLDEIE